MPRNCTDPTQLTHSRYRAGGVGSLGSASSLHSDRCCATDSHDRLGSPTLGSRDRLGSRRAPPLPARPPARIKAVHCTGGARIRNGLFCGGRTAPVLLVCRYWDWSQIEGMSQARLASEGFRLEIPHARAVTVHFLQFWKPYTTLAITPCEWRCHSVESRLD